MVRKLNMAQCIFGTNLQMWRRDHCSLCFGLYCTLFRLEMLGGTLPTIAMLPPTPTWWGPEIRAGDNMKKGRVCRTEANLMARHSSNSRMQKTVSASSYLLHINSNSGSWVKSQAGKRAGKLPARLRGHQYSYLKPSVTPRPGSGE